MELKDLRPAKSSFTLSSTGKEYYLRPISLLDEIWLGEEFGDDIANIFANDSVDMRSLSRIVYRQIENKEDFRRQEVTIIDEYGDERSESLGGHKMLQMMILGMEDKVSIINAFNNTMLSSRPEMSESSEEVKKKIEQTGP